jgi:hypothetical protein
MAVGDPTPSVVPATRPAKLAAASDPASISRIAGLEARVRELEDENLKLKVALEQLQISQFEPVQRDSNSNSMPKAPSDWVKHQFNGVDYYLVPLDAK